MRSASDFKAVSRWPGTLPIGRSIESLGLTDGRAGSKASKSPTGGAAQEVFGIMRLVFALESCEAGKERGKRRCQSRSG